MGGTPPNEAKPAHAATAAFHRTLRGISLAVMAGCLCAPAVFWPFGVVFPRAVGFRLIILFVAGANLYWWTQADGLLRRATRRARMLRAGLAAAMVLAMLPLGEMFVFGRGSSMGYLPVGAVGAIQLWHMMIAPLLPVFVAVLLLWRGALRVWQALRRASMNPQSEIRNPQSPAMSRRQWLASTSVCAPVVLLGGGSAVSWRRAGTFEVNRHALPCPWLPARLRGLTITHVSDLHLGRLYRPYMLPRLVDAVNALDSDLVVVTGDIVDLSNDMLPAAIHALRQFRHRHGMYLCVGNHDLIDDGREFIATLRSADLRLLVNEREPLRIGGERITIAGIDWAGREIALANRPGHAEHVQAALAGYDPLLHGPCLALAHHPHAFDHLAAAGVPLTLSGHTHGGQLMFRPPDPAGRGRADLDVGTGGMIFRYVRGFYHRDAAALFVNRGVGNWFPLRINAPAEIAQIQLV